MAACTIIDSGGISIWEMTTTSFLSVLHHRSRPIHFQRDHRAQMFPSCPSHVCSGDLHHYWFSIAAYSHLRYSASFSTACGSVAPFLSKASAKIMPVRRSLATNIGVAFPLG